MLIREVAYDWTLEKFYVAVIQEVLLYGSDTWVLTPRMQMLLGRFHHRVACRLMGRQPRKGRNGGWVYPPLKDAMAEAVLQEVETYVSCCQNTVAQYISTSPTMDLYLEAKWRPGPRVAIWWW